MSPYSLWTSMTGVIESGNNKMNNMPTSQCNFVLDFAVYQFHIVQGRVTGQYYWVNKLTPFVIPFAWYVGRNLVFQDNNIHAHCAQIINAHLQEHNIHEYYGQQ